MNDTRKRSCSLAGKWVLLLLALFFMTVQNSRAQMAATHPKYEVRAVWLTTIGGIDWPHSYAYNGTGIEKQQRELIQILDQLKQANINTILLQTRVRATTIYPSAIEPWDGCLSGHPGASPGYDALKFAIDECHKRGMECHAWVVTLPAGKWNGAGCRNLKNTRPELLRKVGEDGFMNPEHAGTASYIANICREITRRYDIDGIHLDYIRYPDGWKITIPRSQARDNITRIVRTIHDAVKQEKPWVKMSCSPVGKFNDLSRYSSHGWNAYNAVCQDAQGWLRDGLMDQLYPMMYFRDNQFFPFALDWKENSYGKTVAPGLGIYFLNPREGKWQQEDVTRQLHVLRQTGMGYAFFRSKFFTDNTKDIFNYTCNYVNNYPALVPPMTWASRTMPAAPDWLNVAFGNTTQLSWSGTTPYYNVYASATYPVDVNDARNLIAQRVMNNSLTIDSEQNRFYAVTGMDRYGNESQAVQSYERNARRSAQMLKNDGRRLQLPKNKNILDADFVVIESMQGAVLATRPYNAANIDISSLPDGVYILRSLNKKGITHRLGQFIIRR
jgi:uncharacterized lipoprotein YddW (UPF0748 family)